MQLDQHFLYNPTTGNLRATRRGQQHLGRLFKKFGISLANIRTITELNSALERLPERYQHWVGHRLTGHHDDSDSLLARFEMSIITQDDDAFSELLAQLSKQDQNQD